MYNDCNGCYENATRQRARWHVCDTCAVTFDQAKKDAQAALLLSAYDPEARRWRITGSALGDVSKDDMGQVTTFKVKRPIIVEDRCKWCAIHKALLSVDPWAFELIFKEHGEYPDHSKRNVDDGNMWSDADRTLEVEDLGLIGEDVWNARRQAPQLMVARRR